VGKGRIPGAGGRRGKEMASRSGRIELWLIPCREVERETPHTQCGGVTFIYIANVAAIHGSVPIIQGRC
jgi:hypothetical protein